MGAGQRECNLKSQEVRVFNKMPSMLLMRVHISVLEQVCVCVRVLLPVGLTIRQTDKCVAASDSKTFASLQENSKLPT